MDTPHEDNNTSHGRSYIGLVLLLIAVGLGLRIFFAARVQHPGHADCVFYYTVAENLVDGRGFTVDYIWHYLTRPDTITHPSNDYWLPLMSIIISAPMFVFGKSIFAALLPAIVASLLLAWITWALAIELTRSRFIAAASTILVLFFPPLFEHTLRAEGTVVFALFASSSLLLAIKSRRTPWLFLPAILLAGLAQQTRQDGLLLILVLFVWLFLSPWPGRKKAVYALAGALVFAAVLTPSVILNLNTLGTPFPAGTTKTLFISDYEDLYSYSNDMNLGTYLKSGISKIVRSKAKLAAANAYTLYRSWGELLSIFTAVGAVLLLRRRRDYGRWVVWLPPVLFLAALYVFYSIVIGFSSSFERSALAIAPFVIVFGIITIRKLVSPTATLAIIVLLAASFLFQSVQNSRLIIREDARMQAELLAVKQAVLDDIRKRDQRETVIMTRGPWEVYYSTRFKAVQIPNDDIDVIFEVARTYGANYLLLPAPRAALNDIYLGKRSDDRLPFVADIPGSHLKLYHIAFAKAK